MRWGHLAWTVAMMLAGTTANAETPVAQAKFISTSESGILRASLDDGGFDLPQIGSSAPDGPKRLTVGLSDETLLDYARASFIALEVMSRYSEDMSDAADEEEARAIAKGANAELAEVLQSRGEMGYGTFVRISDRLRRDAALRHRAARIAEALLDG